MPEPEGRLGFRTQWALNVASTFQGRTPKEGGDNLNLGTGEPTVHSQYAREQGAGRIWGEGGWVGDEWLYVLGHPRKAPSLSHVLTWSHHQEDILMQNNVTFGVLPGCTKSSCLSSAMVTLMMPEPGSSQIVYRESWASVLGLAVETKQICLSAFSYTRFWVYMNSLLWGSICISWRVSSPLSCVTTSLPLVSVSRNLQRKPSGQADVGGPSSAHTLPLSLSPHRRPGAPAGPETDRYKASRAMLPYCWGL